MASSSSRHIESVEFTSTPIWGMELRRKGINGPQRKRYLTMADKTKLVTGLFRNRNDAEAAVNRVLARGYDRDDLTVLMSDSTRSKEFAFKTGTKAAEGAGVGGAVGGTVGAVIAAIAAVGTTLAVPGLGLIIAGPLAAALAGAGAGGAAGSLIGMLVGAGIPEHRAKVYEAGLREGGILLGVEARSKAEAEEFEELFESIGAEGVRKE
jgi:hypothetical protein